MQINNPSPINSTDPTPSTSRTDSPTAGTTSNPQIAPVAPSSSPAVSAGDYGMAPSFELLSLNAALSEVPPMRSDVVAETSRRLAAGDLQTPSAVEQTASAILG